MFTRKLTKNGQHKPITHVNGLTGHFIANHTCLYGIHPCSYQSTCFTSILCPNLYFSEEHRCEFEHN